MKTGTGLIEGLRHKLEMMVVPIDGPCHVKADNLSVARNSSQPESTLKKKSNSIAFHCVWERVAAQIISVQCEPTDTNLADILTKIQSGSKWLQLAGCICFNFDSLSFCVSFFIGHSTLDRVMVGRSSQQPVAIGHITGQNRG